MALHDTARRLRSAPRSVVSAAGRTASASVRFAAAGTRTGMDVSLRLEGIAVRRVLGSNELQTFLDAAFDAEQLDAAVRAVLASGPARRVVAAFFESGLFDEIADQLLASRALWRIVDELAASPAVTAAISQQGLGFADQVGDQLRTRSREADDWLERAVHRWGRRRARTGATAEVTPAADTGVTDAPTAEQSSLNDGAAVERADPGEPGEPPDAAEPPHAAEQSDAGERRHAAEPPHAAEQPDSAAGRRLDPVPQ